MRLLKSQLGHGVWASYVFFCLSVAVAGVSGCSGGSGVEPSAADEGSAEPEAPSTPPGFTPKRVIVE